MAKHEANDYIDELIQERGEPQSWEAANRLIMEALLRLGIDRHRSYGPGNIMKFKQQGLLIRISDKWERLYNIVFNGKTDGGETQEDSWGDLANYSVYGIMVGRGWFDLPLNEVVTIPSSAVASVGVPETTADRRLIFSSDPEEQARIKAQYEEERPARREFFERPGEPTFPRPAHSQIPSPSETREIAERARRS